VLQWHHLLSLVPGEDVQRLATQIFADGMFHVLMYIVTATGLWLLWRRRRQLADLPGGGRRVLGAALAGFAIWNFVDVAFFHWTLGIHRIRVGVPDPMVYDIGWLLAFGAVPGAIAWALLRRSSGGHGGTRAAATISLLSLVAAPLAALPQPNSDTAVVLFAPGTSPATAINAAMAAGTPIIWADPAGRVLALSMPEGKGTAALYGNGAMLVTRSPALAGCAAALTA
jgi:uncharacterized membrane protein